jgi:hypothetical protein
VYRTLLLIRLRFLALLFAIALAFRPTSPAISQDIPEQIPASDILASWSGNGTMTLHFQSKERWGVLSNSSDMWRLDIANPPNRPSAIGSRAGGRGTYVGLSPGEYDITISTEGPWELLAYRYHGD